MSSRNERLAICQNIRLRYLKEPQRPVLREFDEDPPEVLHSNEEEILFSAKVKNLMELPLFFTSMALGAEVGNIAGQLISGVPVNEVTLTKPSAENVNATRYVFSLVVGVAAGPQVLSRIISEPEYLKLKIISASFFLQRWRIPPT